MVPALAGAVEGEAELRLTCLVSGDLDVESADIRAAGGDRLAPAHQPGIDGVDLRLHVLARVHSIAAWGGSSAP